MVAQNRASQPSRAVEGHHALVRVIDPGAQLLQPVRHPPVAPPDGLGRAMEQVAHQFGEEHDDAHEHADAGDDHEAAEKKIEQREPEHIAALAQRPAGAEEHGERARDGKEEDGGDEAHEGRGDRHRQRHAVAPHRVHRHGPGAGVERGDVAGPGPHASGQDQPFERWVGDRCAGRPPRAVSPRRSNPGRRAPARPGPRST